MHHFSMMNDTSTGFFHSLAIAFYSNMNKPMPLNLIWLL